MSRATRQGRVGPERRRAPRVATRLPVILADESRAIIASTRNLSALGAYCTLRRFLPPMTKLHVRFEIPGRSQPRQIACQGVVVRVEPPRTTPRRSRYHVAIFFNDLADGDRSTIARYVQQQLHVARSVTHR